MASDSGIFVGSVGGPPAGPTGQQAAQALGLRDSSAAGSPAAARPVVGPLPPSPGCRHLHRLAVPRTGRVRAAWLEGAGRPSPVGAGPHGGVEPVTLRPSESPPASPPLP